MKAHLNALGDVAWERAFVGFHAGGDHVGQDPETDRRPVGVTM